MVYQYSQVETLAKASAELKELQQTFHSPTDSRWSPMQISTSWESAFAQA